LLLSSFSFLFEITMKRITYLCTILLVFVLAANGCKKKFPCPTISWLMTIDQCDFYDKQCVDGGVAMMNADWSFTAKDACNNAVTSVTPPTRSSFALTSNKTAFDAGGTHTTGSTIDYAVTIMPLCCLTVRTTNGCPTPSNGAQNELIAQGTWVVRKPAAGGSGTFIEKKLNSSDFKLVSINCC